MGFYPQLWNSHVMQNKPRFQHFKKKKSCSCGSTTKHTSKRNSTHTLRVLQMQQGRYQYSKSQYPFVVYLFWYSVFQRATLYKIHHEQTARTYLLEMGISGEEGFCRALLLMLFWLQRSWCKPVGCILAPRKRSFQMRLHSCRTTTFTRVTSFPTEKNKPRCGGNLSPGLALKTEAGLPLTNCFLSWCNSKRASCFCCVMVCINVAVYVCLCVCVCARVRASVESFYHTSF